MSKIKGITVTLINKVKNGVDDFGHPTYTEKRTNVNDVLVMPLTSTEIIDALNLTGKKAVYNIAVPKGDGNVWKDQQVEFFGHVWKIVGFPKSGIEENMPLKWNEVWMVADYE